MRKLILPLLLLFMAGQAPASESFPWSRSQGKGFADPSLGKFLPVNEAFQASAWRSDGRLYVGFLNAPGYYLHRHQFALESRDPTASFGELGLPPGELIKHPHLGEMYVFYDKVVFSAPTEAAGTDAGPLAITVTFQGCSDDGLCYPPAQVDLEALLGSPPAVFASSVPVSGFPDSPQARPVQDVDGNAYMPSNTSQ